MPRSPNLTTLEHECQLQLLRKLTAEADEAEFERERASIKLAIQRGDSSPSKAGRHLILLCPVLNMDAPTKRPKDPRNHQFWREPLAWLLRESPGLLGETSNFLSVQSALESGGPGDSVASSDEHHDALIDRLDHVARARDLGRTWQLLSREEQFVLLVYYEPRSTWPIGCEAHLGAELASVALAFSGDRKALLDACSHASTATAQRLIEDAKTNARALLEQAHEAWDVARRASFGWRTSQAAPVVQARMNDFEARLFGEEASP